jgi:hypothetical protein
MLTGRESYGRQIKAEPVHVHLQHPVAQAVHNELAHDRVVAVERVAATAVVVVLASRGENIVHTVAYPPVSCSEV